MEILKTRRDVAPPAGTSVTFDGGRFWGLAYSLADVSTITSFSRSPTAPPSGTTTRNVSESGNVPIYIWLDGTALLWYTEARVTYLSQNASGMFSGFSSVTSISLDGISSIKTSNMNYMFYLCSSLRTILVSDAFATTNLTSSTDMFNGCSRLVGGAGTAYSSSHIDGEYARIDNPPDFPGYFTEAT